MGLDYAWEVEHHFLEEYSHCPAPEVFLGAASQRTKQIRLGHDIIQLTTNHPARVAERVSALDLLSNGRVEFGMGEGGSIQELGPFDCDMDDKRSVWEDGVRAILPMFNDGSWEYHGEHFDFPLRNVLPKPVQKPHPPLWVACSQLETIEMAGRRGIGALGFQFALRYYGADRIGKDRLRPPLGTANLWEEYEKWKHENPEAHARAVGGGLIGPSETIRNKLRKFETSNVDQIILLNQAGKNSHEHICESLELFAKEVMPEFHANEPKHQAW